MQEYLKGIRASAAEGVLTALTDGCDRTCWTVEMTGHTGAVIDVDLGQISNVSAMCVTPEQYAGQAIEHNDRPCRYRLACSLDGVGYETLIPEGEIVYADYNDNSPKFIPLQNVTTRYVRLELLSPTGRRPDGLRRITVAELEFLHGFDLDRPLEPRPEAVAALARCFAAGEDWDCFHVRGNLSRSYAKMQAGLPACVAFVGGSITEMDGWRNETENLIRAQFPDNPNLTFMDAGISSYDSSAHAFRLEKDVLSRGKVDLMILEAAVNDEFNGRSAEEIRFAFEGICRQALAQNPQMDLIFLYFADDLKIEEYGRTGSSRIVELQEQVASAYGAASIDLSGHVCRAMARGDYDWKTFGGLHPAPFGHRIYAERLAELLLGAWQAAETGEAPCRERKLPEPLSDRAYSRGRTVDPVQAQAQQRLTLEGFTVEPSWDPADGISTRTDFVDVPMLVGRRPGDRLTFRFSGTALLLFTASGPDSAAIRFRIDGGTWEKRDLHTDWSDGLHLPWVTLLRNDLDPGSHRAELEILENPAAPRRTHCIIRYFLVNEL